MISIAVLIIVDVVVVVVVVVASTRIFRFFFAVPKSAAIFFFAQSAARNESGDGPSRLCFVLFLNGALRRWKRLGVCSDGERR